MFVTHLTQLTLMTCRQKKHVDKETSFHVLELFSSPIWKNLFLCAHLFPIHQWKKLLLFFLKEERLGFSLISWFLVSWLDIDVCFMHTFIQSKRGMLLRVLLWRVDRSVILKLAFFVTFLPFVTWNSLCKVKSFLFLSPFEFCPNCSFPPVYFIFIFRYCGKVLALSFFWEIL